jgi:hypothetical protein
VHFLAHCSTFTGLELCEHPAVPGERLPDSNDDERNVEFDKNKYNAYVSFKVDGKRKYLSEKLFFAALSYQPLRTDAHSVECGDAIIRGRRK